MENPRQTLDDLSMENNCAIIINSERNMPGGENINETL